ncbi:MAG: hypothetical protein CV081_05085 [Nitrospira sp. LK265]|nr:hypothetical protein [Nitrospira sp. LK265]
MLSERIAVQRTDLVFEHITLPYFWGWGWLEDAPWPDCIPLPDKFFIVGDERALQLHGSQALSFLQSSRQVEVMPIRTGEAGKTLSALEAIASVALEKGITRRSTVVAMGGGAIGNVAGLLAATIFRGISLIHIPTTIIAAFDSVISLKQAVNVGGAKNLLGTYHTPDAIFCDLGFLRTLERREIVSGLCECAKNALAISPEQIPVLQEFATRDDLIQDDAAMRTLLALSIAAKQQVMRHDAHEGSEAAVLEYGHTIGHAIEALDLERRGNDSISHGECVALGMAAACKIATRRGYMSAGMAGEHDRLLSQVGSSLRMPPNITPEMVVERALRDNKRTEFQKDLLRMVLLKGFGRPAIENDGTLFSKVSVTEVIRAVSTIAGE